VLSRDVRRSEDNKRLVRIGTRTADQYASDDDTSTSTTNLTGSSDAEYEHTGLTVDWLVTRYNLALAQAVLYDATEMGFGCGTTSDGVQLREAVRVDASHLSDRQRR